MAIAHTVDKWFGLDKSLKKNTNKKIWSQFKFKKKCKDELFCPEKYSTICCHFPEKFFKLFKDKFFNK